MALFAKPAIDASMFNFACLIFIISLSDYLNKNIYYYSNNGIQRLSHLTH